MKKALILLILLLFTVLNFGQTKKTLKQLAEIQHDWTANEYGVPEYIKISNNLNQTKNELFNNCIGHLKRVPDLDFKILEKSETNDYIKVEIKTLVRTFLGMHVYAMYDGEINFKDHKIRIKLTLDKWTGNGTPVPAKKAYPFYMNGRDKNFEGRSFYESHKIIKPLINSLSINIIDFKHPNNDDW